MSSHADRGATRAHRKPSAKRRKRFSDNYTCTRCEVKIHWMPGHEVTGPPAGWSTEDGDPYCLRCRRELAAEKAVDNAPDGAGREERAKLRAAAVLDFEILRDPNRPNGEIAKVVRCSVPAVVKSRRRLEESGSAVAVA